MMFFVGLCIGLIPSVVMMWLVKQECGEWHCPDCGAMEVKASSSARKSVLESKEVETLLNYCEHTSFCNEKGTVGVDCECGYFKALSNFTKFKNSIKE
jgi:hypothetical protein